MGVKEVIQGLLGVLLIVCGANASAEQSEAIRDVSGLSAKFGQSIGVALPIKSTLFAEKDTSTLVLKAYSIKGTAKIKNVMLTMSAFKVKQTRAKVEERIQRETKKFQRSCHSKSVSTDFQADALLGFFDDTPAGAKLLVCLDGKFEGAMALLVADTGLSSVAVIRLSAQGPAKETVDWIAAQAPLLRVKLRRNGARARHE